MSSADGESREVEDHSSLVCDHLIAIKNSTLSVKRMGVSVSYVMIMQCVMMLVRSQSLYK